MSNGGSPTPTSINAITRASTNSKTSTRNQPKYQEGEKIFCYHGAFIYEAKCLKVEKETTRGSGEFKYFVHYNGWSKNWDEWVPHTRILKFNEENLKKQKDLIDEKKNLQEKNKKIKALSNTSIKNGESETSLKNHIKSPNSNSINSSASSSSSSSYTSSTSSTSTLDSNPKRRKPNDTSSANDISNHSLTNGFSSKNSNETLCTVDINFKHNKFAGNDKLAIVIPECLKEWLIDDFDLIIHQNKIIRLPSKHTVNSILNDYHRENIKENNHEILDEIINDLLEYFNSMLGSQLLYKFERIQYTEILKMNKKMSEIYGSMHLLRLFERLKQMLEFAPLDADQSLENLIFYVNDILRYLEKLEKSFFDESNYILAPPFYVRSSI